MTTGRTQATSASGSVAGSQPLQSGTGWPIASWNADGARVADGTPGSAKTASGVATGGLREDQRQEQHDGRHRHEDPSVCAPPADDERDEPGHEQHRQQRRRRGGDHREQDRGTGGPRPRSVRLEEREEQPGQRQVCDDRAEVSARDGPDERRRDRVERGPDHRDPGPRRDLADGEPGPERGHREREQHDEHDRGRRRPERDRTEDRDDRGERVARTGEAGAEGVPAVAHVLPQPPDRARQREEPATGQCRRPQQRVQRDDAQHGRGEHDPDPAVSEERGPRDRRVLDTGEFDVA